MGKILVIFIIVAAITSCGPRYFKGAEVEFVQDETVFELSTSDKIRYRPSNENSHIYRLTITDEDGELTLGFPSDELQTYTGESVYINREFRVGFEDLEYTSTSYDCDSNATIEITSNEYGLLAGTFAAYLCNRWGTGPTRMLIAGTFAGTVEESRW